MFLWTNSGGHNNGSSRRRSTARLVGVLYGTVGATALYPSRCVFLLAFSSSQAERKKVTADVESLVAAAATEQAEERDPDAGEACP